MDLIAPQVQKQVKRTKRLHPKAKKMKKVERVKSERNLRLIWTQRTLTIRLQLLYESRFPRFLPSQNKTMKAMKSLLNTMSPSWKTYHSRISASLYRRNRKIRTSG